MTAVVLALLRRGDRWFLQRRHPANPVYPGLWEFPGGKIETGESMQAALQRELLEEVGLVLRSAQACPAQEGTLTLLPYVVDAEGDPQTELAWGWFTPAEMLRLPIPPRNPALIALLAAEPRPTPSHLIG